MMELDDQALITTAALMGIDGAANGNNFVFVYQNHYFNEMAKAWFVDNSPWPRVSLSDVENYPGNKNWRTVLERAILCLPQ